MRKLMAVLIATAVLAGCGGGAPAATTTADATVGAVGPMLQTTSIVTAAAIAFPSPTATATPDALEVAPTAAAPDTPTVVPAHFVTVTVQSGDTLLGLALAHGVPMAAIQLQNDLGNSIIVQLGQALVIPPPSAWEGASPYWIVHEVSAGETLSEIAQGYGLALDVIQGANGLADVDLLSIGQALVLPLTDLATARPVVAAPTPAPVAAAPEQAPAVQTPAADAPVAGAVTEVAAPVAVAAPPADLGEWPHEVARIMNEVRATHGLPPLAYNETLAQAAQIQANDCSERSSCSHTGSDGSTIKDRVLRVGYAPASWAECWAIRPSPQGAIDIWMDEVPPNDPHRRTLLTTWLTEIGIGVAPGPWNYTYVIAVFGRPLQ